MAELRADVFAGVIDPAQIVVVRAVVREPAGQDVDTALFSDVRANYLVEREDDGTTTVEHVPPPPPVPLPPGEEDPGEDDTDGTDTLTGVERLVFADAILPTRPVSVRAAAGDGSATISWTGPGVGSPDRVEIHWTDSRGDDRVTRPADGRSPFVLRGLLNGRTYRFQVRAFADGAPVNPIWVVSSNAVKPATVPGAPTIGAAGPRNAAAIVRWRAPSANGGRVIAHYRVQVLDRRGRQVGALRTAGPTATRLLVRGLTNRRVYRFRVAAVNAVGAGAYTARSNPVTPARRILGR
jgi:Fibronectin type III domain